MQKYQNKKLHKPPNDIHSLKRERMDNVHVIVVFGLFRNNSFVLLCRFFLCYCLLLLLLLLLCVVVFWGAMGSGVCEDTVAFMEYHSYASQ